MITVAAGTIPGLINTGATTPVASPDPNWSILSPTQQAIAMNNHPFWLPNTAESKWVWETDQGTPVNVIRTFRISFDLTGFDPTTAWITGRFAADNAVSGVSLNGVPQGLSGSGFVAWTNFMINSGFVPGVNKLDFQATDFGVIRGFRAEFLDSFAQRLPDGVIPEPSSVSLLVAGIGAVALRWRRC